MSKLAINGGRPVRSGGWPEWPQAGGGLAQLSNVLTSGRWAISGEWVGQIPKEQEFAQKFSDFTRSQFCIPTDHGSSSLVIALEALDLGPGDEVIIPVLTWIATATAVLNVNAIPVLVDVDPETGCMSPAAVRKAITSRTKAIIAVHLHYLMVDMDAMLSIAREFNIYLIEDCAQAHGAGWNGRPAGTLGHIGAFSMQQSKVLTCGEGGAVITDDPNLADRLEQLRADSRAYSRTTPESGQPHLWEKCDVMGANYSLSEFQAGLLLDQLDRLEEQNIHRQRNVIHLRESLQKVPGIRQLSWTTKNDPISVYEFAIQILPESFAFKALPKICKALSEELGFNIYQTDLPLHRNSMYKPWSKRRYYITQKQADVCSYRDHSFPFADQFQATLLVFHHAILLGDERDMDDIVCAFAKVQEFAHQL